MKTPALAALAAVILLGCISDSGRDRDRDRDRDLSQAEERARRSCVDEATALGWRVEKVGRIEKVAKKEYEVKLRVTSRNKQLKKSQDEDRVLCRYDDKSGSTRID
jgi:hypothetical protein